MDIDLSSSSELDKRNEHMLNRQTILKTPEKPPSPVYNYRQNHVTTVLLAGVPIVCLFIDGKERLCLAQISNTLLKSFSYNEIHNRRVALGITCVQCTPVQLEILRRAGAMPISSRRCGMITKREAERLVKSFLEDNAPPKLPENFYFEVEHQCGWGCRGRFEPSRYNSSRAKCIKCTLCNLFFSPNKFIFHFHRTPESKYNHPDAANFNSWRRHLNLVPGGDTEDIMHAWEDVKAMFNGGSRKRTVTPSGSSFGHSHSIAPSAEPKKPKLHMDNAEISKQTFPSQYPNYSMFPVPGKAYPFTPLAAHSQLGITFPFSKESSQHEPAKQNHSFGHTPWRTSSNFIFPTYDLLWANHFNMGNINSQMTSFRPNIYESSSIKDLSLFSVDRHSPSDSANSTEDDESEISPIGNNIPSTFSQSNQRLSAFKPVQKTDSASNDRGNVDIETLDDAKETDELVENSDVDIDDGNATIQDRHRPAFRDMLSCDIRDTCTPKSDLRGTRKSDLRHTPRSDLRDTQISDLQDTQISDLRDTQTSDSRDRRRTDKLDRQRPDGQNIKYEDEIRHQLDDQDKFRMNEDQESENIPEKKKMCYEEAQDLKADNICHVQKTVNNNEETEDKNVVEMAKNQDKHSDDAIHSIQVPLSPKESLGTSVMSEADTDADTREQVEKTIDRIQGSLQDQVTMEKCQKEDIAQQLQILKDALCSELEQERKIRFSMQQKLKEAHDALHNFSCKILSARQCTDCTFKETAPTMQR